MGRRAELEVKAIKVNGDETIEFAPDCEIQRLLRGKRSIAKMFSKAEAMISSAALRRTRKTIKTNLSLFVSFRVFDGRLQVFAKVRCTKAAQKIFSFA